jgi:hypothetical protein
MLALTSLVNRSIGTIEERFTASRNRGFYCFDLKHTESP